MKRILSFLALFGSSLLLHAQQDELPETKTYIETQDSLFLHLDKTRIPSGVLYDRVFPWADLSLGRLPDLIDYAYTEQAWYELELATYDRNAIMMTADAMKQRILENEQSDKGITLGYIDYRFNSMDTNALKNGAIVYGDDSLLYDGIGNPYLNHRTTLPLISSQELKGSQVKFYLDPDVALDNTADHLDYMEITLAETGHKIRIDPGQELSLDISGITDSLIKGSIKISKGGILLPGTYPVVWHNGNVAMLSAFFNDPCYDDGIIWSGTNLTFKGYDEATATQGKGEYKIFYHQQNNSWGSCDKSIKKPIIIIDGFDPGDGRWILERYKGDKKIKGIWDLLQYGNNKHLGDELRKKGYDVIVLNFPNYKTAESGADRDGGADYIERNAMVLVKLIQLVNAGLSQSSSNEKIVVVGPSMGGQIARYGLAYMEKYGLNHNTRLYVSFDSPHKGANIPLSLQKSIYAMGYGLNKKGAKDSYNNQLRSKAARQLLIEQTDGANGTAVFHTQYYNNYLVNNGISGSNGWPVNLRKVSLINGTALGKKTGTEGVEIFNVYAGGFIKVINVKASSMPVYGSSINPFYRVGGFVSIFNPSYSVSENINNNNSRGSMDVVSGGTYTTGAILRDEIKETAAGMNIGTFTNVLQETHCFIPSVSALAFNQTNFNWANAFNNRNLVCNNEIPFNNYFTAKVNEDHVSLTETSAKWITAEIERGQPGCPNICKNTLLVMNDVNTPLCIGSTRTFYHNYAIPAGATVTWDYRDVAVQMMSSNSYSITIKAINDAPAYVKATIHNPCGADIVEQFDFAAGSGYSFSVSDENILHPNGYTKGKILTVKPNSPYITSVRWSLDGTNYSASQTSYNVYKPELSDYRAVWIKTQNSCGESYMSKNVWFTINEYNEYYGIRGIIPDLNPAAMAVSVYPNPSTANWTVELPLTELDANLELYDVNGRKIWKKQKVQLQAEVPGADLPAGIYLLKITIGTQEKMQKLIRK
ncbi:hypothetical protein DBR32_04795 [Taibaiella sp. KBW10]|uniref:T9SS type A sorting domain-containing protein n=1 Tax=Taibaiella sp. KBW10 TaxID=2153357 RepID=UPI000F59BFFB|nr:T9SS type A sorting domain-containing protein [Taibaiella sp. KBW10]RQO31289.1 hypothetical protein DBR32_04795 [Taibaiella sp. KBW10]